MFMGLKRLFTGPSDAELDQRLKELGGLGQQLNRVRQVVVDAVQKSKSELQRLLDPSAQQRADA